MRWRTPPRRSASVSGWQAEWKWDGIRSQLIRRGGQTFLWSRGEELVTERYPELAAVGDLLPEGTVLDGEILPWKDGGPLPFAQLQRRIGRKTVGKTILAEVPVVLVAYDLLEDGGLDVRPRDADLATRPAGGAGRGGGLARPAHRLAHHRGEFVGGAGRGPRGRVANAGPRG